MKNTIILIGLIIIAVSIGSANAITPIQLDVNLLEDGANIDTSKLVTICYNTDDASTPPNSLPVSKNTVDDLDPVEGPIYLWGLYDSSYDPCTSGSDCKSKLCASFGIFSAGTDIIIQVEGYEDHTFSSVTSSVGPMDVDLTHTGTSPPSVTVLHPNGGESIPLGTQVQVSAHATDDNAVTSVTFSYSNNSGSDWNTIGAGAIVSGTAKDGIWNQTWNTNSLGAGSNYLIKAVADDGTSPREDQSDSTFSLTCTSPTIISTHPSNGATDVLVTTTISVMFSEAMNEASAEAAFSVDGVSGVFTWGGNTMTFIPIANLAYDTTYTVTISTTAEDLAGNNLEEEYTWAFTTAPFGDTMPPSIAITYPANGQNFTTPTITIAGTASDDVAVNKVEVKVGSGSWQTASGTTSWSKSVTLVPDSNTIYTRATDTSGNTNDAVSVTVTYVVVTPPSPTLNDPGTTDTDGSYTVSWSSVSDATNYTLEEDTSGSFGSPTIVYSGSGTSTQITDRADGTYYYRVNACNACGCGGWSNVEDIVVDIPSGNIITVDDSGGADYTTIQEAVDNAAGGYTIKVFSGTYNEHVVMDKSLKLIGEDKNTTIVDGSGSGNCINITADNIEISGFTIKNYIHGVYVNSSDGLIIDNNMLLNNDSCGIFMRYSSNNTLSNNYFGKICLFASSNNTLSNNDLYGISLCYSSNNVLVSNTASNNDLRGICLDHSSNNVLDSNTASNNRYDGILMVASSNNLLSNNTLSNNGFRGIRMFYSSNNVLASNTASNNWYGIYLEGSSSSNLIYHNNVIDNYNPAYDDIGTNQWDNGYPVGGNYWSDYMGIDTFSGVDQNVLGSDGIGDTHYGISGGAGAYDRYPFMNKGGWIDEENMSPVASLTYSPLNPAVDQTVAFDSSSSYDQDGQIVNCRLDLGDETVVDGLLPTTIIVYEYSSAGSYTVTLTVTDNDGAFGTETKSIIVTTSLKGDLNHDNQITPADATIALELAASGGWDSAADVDGDRRITSLDALMILQAAGDAIDL
jgi:parallel beta-helix repeat protein